MMHVLEKRKARKGNRRVLVDEDEIDGLQFCKKGSPIWEDLYEQRCERDEEAN